jgi:uncharacterized protein (TIGR02246 family)
VGGLIHAWNAGDALAFAAFFAEDADLVNMHGMHIRGRQAIAGIYDMLFRSVFAASNVTGTIRAVRCLVKKIALVHLKVVVKAQVAPLAGTHDVVTSLVMVHEASRWRVASLHNTLVTANGV